MLLTRGKVLTKNMEDGNTVGVRIDPAKQRRNPLGHSDEVPHAHKEKVGGSHRFKSDRGLHNVAPVLRKGERTAVRLRAGYGVGFARSSRDPR